LAVCDPVAQTNNDLAAIVAVSQTLEDSQLKLVLDMLG
jgi:hypothetical protein